MSAANSDSSTPINSSQTIAGFVAPPQTSGATAKSVKTADTPSQEASKSEPLAAIENADATCAGFRRANERTKIEAKPTKNAGNKQIETPGEPQDPHVGTQVGKFRIDSVIASGGMGTVYKATQLHPVQRTVALKMIRSGMADQATIQRFHAERQALALMDHPDIAKVYEADTSKAGHPFFAMEYCDGLPIDQYCKRHQVTLHERIKLVARVARAVQRAHGQGVIHRDLKPDNILVSDCNEAVVVKIIDFGIVKFTDDQWQSVSGDATRIGELVGTPAYMSPEQAGTEPIDGRTDVFAIGAILFKLLTGSTPLLPPKIEDPQGDSTRSLSLTEIINHIQEFEPTIPSRRLAEQTESLNDGLVDEFGSGSFKKLRSSIQGDLDWITLKATEKDKVRRYATAGDLADDLERFLNDEPVQAAAPSLLYKSRKFYARKRGLVLATSAILATVFLAASYMGFQAWQRNVTRQARIAKIAQESSGLLHEAEQARIRAGSGGPTSKTDLMRAKTSLAKAESMLEDHPALLDLQRELQQLQSAIRSDQIALETIARLNDARERGTHIRQGRLTGNVGTVAALAQISETLGGFGVEPNATPFDVAAKKFLACPKSTQTKFRETLDFMINETPLGCGIYIHQLKGQISIAQVVANGPAELEGSVRLGDRILKIDDVDLVNSVVEAEMRKTVYRLLFRRPGSRIKLTLVRGINDPFEVELECRGEAAFWAAGVLKEMDPDPWRTQLRQAVLSADAETLSALAESEESKTSPPFSQIQLATMQFLVERSNESIEVLRNCQRQYPGNFWANHYLGVACTVAHDPPIPEQGLRYLMAAVALRPHSVGARLNLAEGYLRDGDSTAYQSEMRVVANLDESFKAKPESTEPKLAGPTGEIARRKVERLDETINQSANENDANLPFEHGEFEKLELHAIELAGQGKRDEALQVVQVAQEQFKGDARLLRLKGIVLLYLEDYVAARIVLSDAARSLPNDAASRYYYGFALQYSGNSSDAIHEYRAALHLRPDYAEVQKALDYLQQTTASADVP